MFFGVFKDREVIDNDLINDQVNSSQDLVDDFGNFLDDPNSDNMDLTPLSSLKSCYIEDVVLKNDINKTNLNINQQPNIQPIQNNIPNNNVMPPTISNNQYPNNQMNMVQNNIQIPNPNINMGPNFIPNYNQNIQPNVYPNPNINRPIQNNQINIPNGFVKNNQNNINISTPVQNVNMQTPIPPLNSQLNKPNNIEYPYMNNSNIDENKVNNIIPIVDDKKSLEIENQESNIPNNTLLSKSENKTEKIPDTQNNLNINTPVEKNNKQIPTTVTNLQLNNNLNNGLSYQLNKTNNLKTVNEITNNIDTNDKLTNNQVNLTNPIQGNIVPNVNNLQYLNDISLEKSITPNRVPMPNINPNIMQNRAYMNSVGPNVIPIPFQQAVFIPKPVILPQVNKVEEPAENIEPISNETPIINNNSMPNIPNVGNLPNIQNPVQNINNQVLQEEKVIHFDKNKNNEDGFDSIPIIKKRKEEEQRKFELENYKPIAPGYKACPKCGQVMRDDYKLCFVCGTYF